MAEYLYVFILMFLAIFGLTMLIKLFLGALLNSSRRQFEVYVKSDENLKEFVDYAHRSCNIAKVNIMLSGDKADETARDLAQKYADVSIVGKTGR